MTHTRSALLIETLATSLLEDGSQVIFPDRERIAEILREHAAVLKIILPSEEPASDTGPADKSEIGRLRFALTRLDEVLGVRDAELAGAQHEIEILRKSNEALFARIPSAPDYADDGVGIPEILASLGGAGVFGPIPDTPMGVHRLLARGMPVRALAHLVKTTPRLGETEVMIRLFGHPIRRRLRGDKHNENDFTPEDAEQVWRVAEVLVRAIRTLGAERAVSWLVETTPFLDNERPASLLSTPIGARLVKDLLGRIEYGVYG